MLSTVLKPDNLKWNPQSASTWRVAPLVNLRLGGALSDFIGSVDAQSPFQAPPCFSICISWSDKKSLIPAHRFYLTCFLRTLWLHNIVIICPYLSLNQYLPKYPCGLTCKLLCLSALRSNLDSWKYFQILQNQHLHYWKELIVDLIYSR